MKKTVLNFLLIAGVAAGSISCKNDKQNQVKANEAQEAEVISPEAMTFEIDTAASVIQWRGTKPTGEHLGTIDIQNGQIKATANELVGGRVVINMNSITVTDEGMDEKGKRNLENHLKGTVEGKETDFFNVNKYPEAFFEITGMSEQEGKRMLEGNLTIKDESKHIMFPVTTTIGKEELTLKSETFSIDRTDWGINYRSNSVFPDLGDKFISDNMELTIEVKAKRTELTEL
ncbi:YceI family protein [Salinimicrobium soli]|uniref:YceI family protein n=1 Tax=Salinimicrobium soli TaxID=1254399 RepID=UPI003AAE5526